ncbi:hypothetical protein ASC75_08105 [Aminobacter sp. DSM 101952]|uniref:DUF6428 family protein n=1 Tax=unclassified Aminobacter TaxID=2644704 RepID=UPI0006FD33CF|nr:MULTISPECIES: DUF6428 family protein [unclassified Aminobacter]AWC23694.1 hypothetical protein CO731_03166 [Aminobacter sp. MSH1]KQU70077.1 hypothetical protein ASC75_08105 [Aminobacter sp. DSM 101952]
MLTPDNREFASATDFRNDDISIGELLSFLGEHKEKPLVFAYDGRSVKPGYHVTEVKAGSFAALDCGANPESWTEIFIQLWDVNEEERTHMSAGKFAAIIRKVTEHLALDPTAKLTFEVSDGIAPMQLHKASIPVIADGQVDVELTPRAASCKPRDRWLAEQTKVASSCCGPAKGDGQPCCG